MLAELNRLANKLDRALILGDLGFDPDGWQSEVLRSRSHYQLLNCHRQAGKSTCVSGLAIGTALDEDDALILIVSASLRQSGELFRKVTAAYKKLGAPVPAVEDSATTLALANGSRIVSLPDSPDTLVGFSSPHIIIIDEAARVSDATFAAVSPMLAISRGRMVCMSTPKGRRGWWSEAWHSGGDLWERVEFRADQNPRIDPEFLAEERIRLGQRLYEQEYLVMFNENTDQVFSQESIDMAFDYEGEPIFGGSSHAA